MGTNSTITTDVHDIGDRDALDFDGAADAFLSNLMGAEKPPKKDEEGEQDPEKKPEDAPDPDDGEEGSDQEHEDQEDPDENEGSDGSDEEEVEDEPNDEEGSKGDKVAPDDLEVEVTVGDERHKVSVKELKRLYGQEASLTKKSQEVAEIRKKVETDGAKHAAALDRLMTAAKARWEPYSQIDMLVASREMDPEAFKQLRKDAQEAYQDFQFLTQEVESFVRETEAQRVAQLQEQAKEAIKVLSDPEKGIPGWSTQLYDDIRGFAIGKGLDARMVNSIVDPTVIKLLHAAMQYERNKKAVEEKVHRKVVAPKKVLKTTTPVNRQEAKNPAKTQAKAQLRKTGKIEDAANAFMANWLED